METGRLAKLANGSVLVTYGESVVLVTATMSKPREGIDFFPLTVDFEDRLYARGKIPGSFFRREGRPSTDAVLIDRLTDRPIRPLFPKGFRNETQIIATPLSADMENPLDLLAVAGASAALSISDIPFGGPLGITRVGYVDGEFVINPTYQESAESRLDLVVAGTREGVLMMEAGAHELSEDVVVDAIKLAQETNLQVVDLQDQLIRAAGKEKVPYTPPELPAEVSDEVNSRIGDGLAHAFEPGIGKTEQSSRLSTLKHGLVGELGDRFDEDHVEEAFEAAVSVEFRNRVLDIGQRPDGRGLKEIRPLDCEVGLLPRTHGSGLFQRGETQILGLATLGSVGDAQKIDTLSPDESRRFLLHYNFPPFSTGETKRVGSPGRRDIGHGALAEKALLPVLPSEDDFPYTIRVVAEALGSNGSTSMGSACAGTLALMDAGVPITRPVAGISVGLVTGENGRFETLTDIQGMEDHIGDMDFKVAGTTEGITAIQLDIKVQNIGFEVVEQALAQAKEARMTILDRMAQAISSPREEVSDHAPRLTRISVPVDKIGAVIGPGGKTIRGIVEETNATVDVQDDGTVFIGATDREAAQKAIDMVKALTKEAKTGEIYTGKVVRILDFGAFVEILPGKDGMVHISELADYRVPSVEDVVQLGEEITVMVKDVDPVTGKIALSRRALLVDDGAEGDGGDSRPSGPPPDRRQGGRPPRYGNGRPRGDRGGRPRGDRGGRGGYRGDRGPRQDRR